LALLLPVLVTLVLGCVDFGRFAYNYIAVTNAARAGAAYGMMNNYTSSSQSNWTAGVTQAAKDELTQQVGSGNLSNVTVAVNPSTDTNGLRRVNVQVSYPFTTLVNWNWTGFNIPNSMTLQGQAEVRLIR
jgi:Flp pilus assembly protein TadG